MSDTIFNQLLALSFVFAQMSSLELQLFFFTLLFSTVYLGKQKLPPQSLLDPLS